MGKNIQEKEPGITKLGIRKQNWEGERHNNRGESKYTIQYSTSLLGIVKNKPT